MLLDFRIALRGLRRNSAFAIAVILLATCGIGASTAVFSMVDRLLFRSLPYPQADQMVSVGMDFVLMTDGAFMVANDYLHLRDAATGFSSLTSWRGVSDCDLTQANPRRLSCAEIESTFLGTFGIRPLLGRDFTAAEDAPNGPKAAILTYALWQSRFTGSPGALGRSIVIDDTPRQIVGVLPPEFELPNLAHADVLVPQALNVRNYVPGQSSGAVRVFGRMKPGVTFQQARDSALPYLEDSIHINLPRPRWKEAAVDIRPLRDYQIHDVHAASIALFGATLAILLIVNANIVNLMLARAASRQRELAVRAALGAGRGRLICQQLTESLLLSACGALFGCGLAWALLRIFKTLAPVSIPRSDQAAIDARVLLFALGLAVICAVFAGLAPAAANPLDALTSSRSFGGSSNWLRHALSAAQVALSLILLSGAGLLLRSLTNLQNVSTGLDAQQVIAAEISLGPTRYPNSQSRQQFFDDLAARIRAIPGVSRVAVSDSLPPSGVMHSRPITGLRALGMPPPDSADARLVGWRSVSADYFPALGIPILRGRGFEEQDAASADNRIVLSSSLSGRLFGDADPVGRAVTIGTPSSPYTVIGIAADVRNNGLTDPADPEYYVPRRQITDPKAGTNVSLVARALHVYDGEAFLIVRSSAPQNTMESWIRSSLAAMDPGVPAVIAPMPDRLRQLSERPRFSAVLLSLFAVTGMLLAAAGLYGLMSFLVARRTQEVGVRIALGATPRQIAGLILVHALRWSGLGIAAGVIGSLAVERLLSSLLFGIGPGDLSSAGASAVVLLLVAIAACLAPALRAARIDPVMALRQE